MRTIDGKKKNEKYTPAFPRRSLCCKKPVIIVGKTTLHYECTECRSPCELVEDCQHSKQEIDKLGHGCE